MTPELCSIKSIFIRYISNVPTEIFLTPYSDVFELIFRKTKLRGRQPKIVSEVNSGFLGNSGNPSGIERNIWKTPEGNL